MFSLRFRFIDIVFTIALVFADLMLYVVLALLFSGYEDSYSPQKGPFMSLASMSPIEKGLYIALWLWAAINALIGLILGYKLSMRLRRWWRQRRVW